MHSTGKKLPSRTSYIEKRYKERILRSVDDADIIEEIELKRTEDELKLRKSLIAQLCLVVMTQKLWRIITSVTTLYLPYYRRF